MKPCVRLPVISFYKSQINLELSARAQAQHSTYFAPTRTHTWLNNCP